MADAFAAPLIHPTAIVDPRAELAAGVEIGPYCVIDGPARLGEGVLLQSHVTISGDTRLGPRCRVFPFAALGQPPQDFKYKGEPTELIIGSDVVIREHVTMHRGTLSRGRTTVGDKCYFMVGAHVAHDCVVGDRVTFANAATLGGHCDIADDVILGGLAALHQFTRVGRQAFIGGMATVVGDVIPFGSVVGNHARLAGLNLIGLKRRGHPRETINALRGAYRVLAEDGPPFQEKLDLLETRYAASAEVQEIVAFARADAKRPLCLP